MIVQTDHVITERRYKNIRQCSKLHLVDRYIAIPGNGIMKLIKRKSRKVTNEAMKLRKL